MFEINIMSKVPVYEQIVEGTVEKILKGELSSGDQMPSVRSLSVELTINPNTIQKAYTELDRRGLIYSIAGRGCFVSPDAKEIIQKEKYDNLEKLRVIVSEYRLAGVDKEVLEQLINDIYEGEDRND